MYTEFYGLREKPFVLSPDPRFLFLAGSHREALAHLVYGIEQGEGFIAVTGEVGTGKTTLCRTLLQRLGSETEVAFIFNPDLSPLELLEAIAVELGIQTPTRSRRELNGAVNQFLLKKKREGRRVLLIIDEAQNLSQETLEQVRLLSNLETETSKLIQIVLLGQPELDVKLHSPELRQLRQRISVWWRLSPLDAPETRDYVRHRIRVAGGPSGGLFSDSALREVHRHSRGIPRMINILCDRALLSGYANAASEIGRGQIREAAQELHGAPAPRTAKRSTRRSFSWRPPRLRPIPMGAVWMALLFLLVGAAFAVRFGGGPELLAQWLVAEAPPPQVSAPAPPAEPVETQPVPVTSSAEEPASGVVVLDTLLQALSPGEAHSLAVGAIFDTWQVNGNGTQVASLPDALNKLSDRGLHIQPLAQSDLYLLEMLNHPAILRVRRTDGALRSVALRSIEPDSVILAAGGPAGLRISRAELERRWSGEAYVVWREFEPLPGVLRAGQVGASVRWLQQSLAQLGYFPTSPTGRFDAHTSSAVREFQARHGLLPDGRVGPHTKMAIYAALQRYQVPRLYAIRGRG